MSPQPELDKMRWTVCPVCLRSIASFLTHNVAQEKAAGESQDLCSQSAGLKVKIRSLRLYKALRLSGCACELLVLSALPAHSLAQRWPSQDQCTVDSSLCCSSRGMDAWSVLSNSAWHIFVPLEGAGFSHLTDLQSQTSCQVTSLASSVHIVLFNMPPTPGHR